MRCWALIEMCDDDWLAYFNSHIDSSYLFSGWRRVPLQEAVLALYCLSHREAVTRTPKEYIKSSLALLKRRVLYFAIYLRSEGRLEASFAVWPLVCIGEWFGLSVNDKRYLGRLCQWHWEDKSMWCCEIENGGYRERINFSLRELDVSNIMLFGKIGPLYRSLLLEVTAIRQ